ncbi:MAG: FecR domain-containing protein [Fermentimonas sp.]|nr:FecR domain-containing protein [Fermentimonas sp.]
MSINSKIINNVISEVSTKEEAREVVDWFSSSIEGQHHLSDMIDKDAYLMESDADTGKSFTSLQSDTLFRKIDKNIRANRLKKFSIRVAAVFLPLLLILGLGYFMNSRTTLFQGVNYAELYIPKGENARIFFQDGTEVFLNADTRIRYPDRFGIRKREVFLDGEAYFNVSTNNKRPFIVNSQNTAVKVTGTSFNVNAYSESETIEVVLDEGRTAFLVGENSYSMSPGQQIEYNKTTGVTTLYNLSKSSNVSLWKNNILYFNDTPLAEVLKVLERRYDVKFHIQSTNALDYSYTLITKNNNIDSVLFELQKITPVRFDHSGENDDNVFVTLQD